MEFVAGPGIVDVISPFQLFDNALADVAEGSNVIGINFYFNAHFSSCNCRFLKFLPVRIEKLFWRFSLEFFVNQLLQLFAHLEEW